MVVALAFQLLCPSCVTTAIPQLRHVRAVFAENEVAVAGLHTVFEHHEANTEATLRAFAHENRLNFPIGIDRHVGDDHLPVTMRRYAMQGTPTLLLIDRLGRLRLQHFGHVDDLLLGARIAALVAESETSTDKP